MTMTEQNTSAESPSSTTTPWAAPTRLLFIVIWLIIGVMLIWMSRSVWYVVALALIIAYLLQPLIKQLIRLRVPRPFAAILSLLLVLLIVILIPMIIVPAVIADIEPISIDVNAIWLGFDSWVTHLPETMPGFNVLGFSIDLSPLYDQMFESVDSIESQVQVHMPADLGEFLRQVITSTTQVVSVATVVATNVIGGLAGAFVFFILLLLLTFYATIDLPRLRDFVIGLAPGDFSLEWAELWRRTGVAWSAFFRGQLILSAVIGTTVWAGLTMIGLPGALALGVFAGVMEVIPTLGPILALIPAVFLALLQGSTSYPDASHLTIMLVVLAMYIVIQQIENYVLVPRILGGSVGVHPALILIGVMVFTVQFGILGAFVATPVLATLLIWFKFYHARILGNDPFPELAKAETASEQQNHSPPDSTVPDAVETEDDVAEQNAQSSLSEVAPEPPDSAIVAFKKYIRATKK